jgi:hypothetical protein
MSEFTDDQILTAIGDALRESNIAVVPGLIRLLALQNPDAAQTVMDAIVVRRCLEEATP